MRFGVVVFPGSNCDHDAWYAVSANLGHQAEFLWHDQRSLNNVDAIILPGGFSYGDYLRCGAIAKFSPVMQSVKEFAKSGGLVMGICNGFQILCESGLLPGVLVRNEQLKFICAPVDLTVETTASPFTNRAKKGQRITIPIAHGDGNYRADERTLDRLEAEDRILFRYAEDVPAVQYNGAARRIAGILNEDRNVLGMMPHPERACDPLLGLNDGRVIFESVVSAFALAD
jgi:phosphoribosylformylglycinamidine synthase